MTMHEVHFFRSGCYAVAQCICGWHASGTLEAVQVKASTHDLDEPEEAKHGQEPNKHEQ